MRNSEVNFDSDLDRLAQVTSRYARYSRSAGGLSSVVGGVLTLACFFIGALIPLSQEIRYALVTTPILWLGCKEALRHFYYQRFGAVAEQINTRENRIHVYMTIYLSLMAILIIAGFTLRFGSAAFLWPGLGYIGIIAVTPLIAWRWFWSVSDFLIGTWLFCQIAVVITGGNYPLPFVFVILPHSIIAIITGVREHRDYLKLRSELGVGNQLV